MPPSAGGGWVGGAQGSISAPRFGRLDDLRAALRHLPLEIRPAALLGAQCWIVAVCGVFSLKFAKRFCNAVKPGEKISHRCAVQGRKLALGAIQQFAQSGDRCTDTRFDSVRHEG